MAKTDWQMDDVVLPSDMNQIGEEINQNANNLAVHQAETITNIYNVAGFGAKGDGTDDTSAIQAAINAAPPNSTIYFPDPVDEYVISQLTIPEDKIGLLFLGLSKRNTKIRFTDDVAVVCKSGYFTFQDLRIWGSGSSNALLFSDERNGGTTDFDAKFINCQFEYTANLVKVYGRGVNLDGCIFANWHQNGSVIDADFPDPFTPGGNPYQQLTTGFRSFVVNDCRFHYVNTTILTNTGYNAENIEGIQITNNFIEGKTKYYKGYAKSLLVAANDHFHYERHNDHGSFFDFEGGDNISLNLNIATRTGEPGNFKIIYSNGEINNLNVSGNIDGVRDIVVDLVGGGTNIDIDLNVATLSTVATHYVRLGGSGDTFRNVSIKGRMQSPNASFTGIEAVAGTTVQNYVTELIIGGSYATYSKGLNPLQCISQPNRIGSYVGDGEDPRVVNLRFRPRSVHIVQAQISDAIGEDYNNASISGVTNASTITITDDGFEVSGAANTNGRRYIYRAD